MATFQLRENTVIAIIVINYKKSDLTVQFCESLSKLTGKDRIHVVVVDNAADDSSRETLKNLGRFGFSVEVLHESENWGYFGGARRGLEHLQKGEFPYDWVILSNSDIKIRDQGFLRKLLYYPRALDLGVLAPRIVSGLSWKSQNPYMIERPQAKRMHFYKWVFRYQATCFVYQMLGLTKSLVKRFLETKQARKKRQQEEKPADIYAAHGSFFIFNSRYFALGGSFEHKPFLFGEEVTVAETARRLGLRIRYEPALVVEHVEHATMGWIPSSKTLAFQKEASEYCADTFFPLSKASAGQR